MTRFSPGIFLIASLLAVSCAKPPATARIRVHVPDTFSGYIRLVTCNPAASDPAVLIEGTEEGDTSVCPAGDVELVVIRSTKTTVIAPENVHVRRSSDGAPVAISAEVPSP